MATHAVSIEAAPKSWLARTVSRHSLVIFFALAFAFSWWPWPLTLLNPASTPMVPFGPSIAAIIVTALVAGVPGVKALLGRLVRWRVGLVWYVLALVAPVLVYLLVVYLNVLLGAAPPTRAAYAEWYTLLPAFLSVLLVGGPLFEELGWRGFVLPRLQAKHSALRASLLIWAVWSAWHLPLLVSDITRQRPAGPFLVWMLGLSVLHTWMYNSTRGSMLIVVLFHAVINTAASFFLPMFSGADYTQAWWLMAATTGIAAIAAIVLAGPARLARDVELQE